VIWAAVIAGGVKALSQPRALLVLCATQHREAEEWLAVLDQTRTTWMRAWFGHRPVGGDPWTAAPTAEILSVAHATSRRADC
jgi:hypothetical protein